MGGSVGVFPLMYIANIVSLKPSNGMLGGMVADASRALRFVSLPTKNEIL